jgi:hypothetical protein
MAMSARHYTDLRPGNPGGCVASHPTCVRGWVTLLCSSCQSYQVPGGLFSRRLLQLGILGWQLDPRSCAFLYGVVFEHLQLCFPQFVFSQLQLCFPQFVFSQTVGVLGAQASYKAMTRRCQKAWTRRFKWGARHLRCLSPLWGLSPMLPGQFSPSTMCILRLCCIPLLTYVLTVVQSRRSEYT